MKNGSKSGPKRHLYRLICLAVVLAAIFCIVVSSWRLSHVDSFSKQHHVYSLTHNNNNTATITNGTINPVVFLAPNDTSALCIPQQELLERDSKNSPSNNGLLLVRIPKTGSSTIGGVAARISFAMARQYYNDSNVNTSICCKSRLTHAWSIRQLKRYKSYNTRNRSTSFLWTFLRDPARRAVSGFYFFDVGKNGASVENAIPTLAKRSNHLLKWVSGNKNNYYPVQSIQQVLYDFNFIGLLERLDESLVVLQLLLKLQPQDVLYLEGAKQGGTYDISNHCRKTPQVILTPLLQNYLSSKKWLDDNLGDYLLYDAVNRSLDVTIDSIGRRTFETALDKFRSLKEIANGHCEYKSPCIADGEFRPRLEAKSKCYAEDFGCGYECLDDLFAM